MKHLATTTGVSFQEKMPKLRCRGRQRKPTPSLSPQDEKLEDQDATSLDAV